MNCCTDVYHVCTNSIIRPYSVLLCSCHRDIDFSRDFPVFISDGIISEQPPKQRKGWYSISVEEEISKYYSWFYKQGNLKDWNPSMNGCHITYIAGNREKRIITSNDMKPFIGQKIQYSWRPVVMTNGETFWMDCWSKDLDTIRELLNLEVPKKFGYHITLGNLK